MGSAKFSGLAVGQRFTLDGVAYVKISPLLARSEVDGGSRMIPRSALVEAPDSAATEAAATAADPARRALDDYHRAVQDCLDSLAQNPSATAVATARDTLSLAHARALKRLDATR